MSLRSEQIQLIQFITPVSHPYPSGSASNDLWFQHLAIVVRDMDRAYRVLQAHHVASISTSPQTLPAWNTAAAGIRAFYFRDPDGHPLELIYFPPGKGDQKWQHPSDALFLGIDHTAIAVKDTGRSVHFYSDLLGFHVAGESVNYGLEQERLNHVKGSRVHITGLRLPAGPGVELLEYVHPGNGRPVPPYADVADIVHVHTTILVDSQQEVSALLNNSGGRRVSRSLATSLPFAPWPSAGALIEDPDGHEILVRTQ
jgi:catechol 2,3-dioxygenase-like lactoylglutathione lyase family enzyme